MPSDPPIVPTVLHCPRCKSDRVTGRRESLRDPAVREFYCASCKLYEEREETAPDYAEWFARWEEVRGGGVHITKTKEEWKEYLDQFRKKKT